jgi:hypothetical protein
MAQSNYGQVEVFEKFIGVSDELNSLLVPRAVGQLRAVGQGSADTDSGAVRISGGGLRLTTTNEADHTYALETNPMFVAGTMGTLVAEARVQFENLDTKEAFFGFTDIAISGDVPSLEVDLMTGTTVTHTLTASDLVGFYLSAELTADESWHGVYNGGATTGETSSVATDLVVDAVAGEWQILRLEVDPNGTAYWYVDDVLKQTVVGAVSTTAVLKGMIGVEAKGAAIETLDVFYTRFRANTIDWTV